jgi:hypothetical protein
MSGSRAAGLQVSPSCVRTMVPAAPTATAKRESAATMARSSSLVPDCCRRHDTPWSSLTRIVPCAPTAQTRGPAAASPRRSSQQRVRVFRQVRPPSVVRRMVPSLPATSNVASSRRCKASNLTRARASNARQSRLPGWPRSSVPRQPATHVRPVGSTATARNRSRPWPQSVQLRPASPVANTHPSAPTATPDALLKAIPKSVRLVGVLLTTQRSGVCVAVTAPITAIYYTAPRRGQSKPKLTWAALGANRKSNTAMGFAD